MHATTQLLNPFQGGNGSPALLLSSSRREVRLWDVTAMEGGPVRGWDDCRGGHFNNAGTVIAAVSSAQIRCCSCCRNGLYAGRATSSAVSGKSESARTLRATLPLCLLYCLFMKRQDFAMTMPSSQECMDLGASMCVSCCTT